MPMSSTEATVSVTPSRLVVHQGCEELGLTTSQLTGSFSKVRGRSRRKRDSWADDADAQDRSVKVVNSFAPLFDVKVAEEIATVGGIVGDPPDFTQ